MRNLIGERNPLSDSSHRPRHPAGLARRAGRTATARATSTGRRMRYQRRIQTSQRRPRGRNQRDPDQFNARFCRTSRRFCRTGSSRSSGKRSRTGSSRTGSSCTGRSRSSGENRAKACSPSGDRHCWRGDHHSTAARREPLGSGKRRRRDFRPGKRIGRHCGSYRGRDRAEAHPQGSSEGCGRACQQRRVGQRYF